VDPKSTLVEQLDDEVLRRMVEDAPDGIVVVDSDGTILYANPMALRLFGYEPGELAGRPVEALLPKSAHDAHVVHRTEYVRYPRARPMGSGLSLNGQRKSGEEFPVEISLSPVHTEAHGSVIAIVRDVTERRRAADELNRANEALALVDDRERIARDLHDTVIQRLFGVGLFLQGALAEAGDGRVGDRIATAIDEIDGTIRDVRTAIFSLHARRVPTAGLRDDVLATSREAGRALGFEPQVTFDGPIDTLASDAIREQLVPTLREALSNIVKHANASRASVRLAVVAHDIVLEVTDNGIGISERAAGGRGVGNMGERAVALGGQCEFHEAQPSGTTVIWRVPTSPHDE
jgi:PAS domain S-box-containing protein